MSQIFDQTFERTLDTLLANAEPGQSFEAWSFDDAKSRREAENRLKKKGVSARIRSAYKPLLFTFLEEISLDGVDTIEVRYPVHASAPANRFRLEAYPLAALVGDTKIDFIARKDDEFHYDVTLSRNGKTETLKVLAPNRVHTDIVGETNVSPTGWFRPAGNASGERLETDFERLFEAAIQAVADHGWGDNEPYFEELNIRVTHPAEDLPLAVGDEVVSLREALHEDFYFSLLEFFQKKSGRPLGDRGLKPGQIVPEIVKSEGEVSVRIEARRLTTVFLDGREQEIDTASEPVAAGQLTKLLEEIGGEAFEARSRSGRILAARYVAGSDAAVMISGGQHPNETTGIVGAIRAARRLAGRKGAHFTISPLENPDGYALHQRLRADNPRHMHHAARYTALGDDLEYRTLENSGSHINEKEIRFKAQDISGASLHVNLHGYPSHEWTRPLSGYVPRNFAMWTLPKGFFLIIRHHADWERQAEALLDRVTRHLGAIPGLLDYNNRQIALYEIHAGETGFRIINGFPCLSSVDDRHTVPMTLITEYPDETIYGNDFITGHTAQMETVLSAYDAWQEILSPQVA
ncbi:MULTISPECIES: M14 family metallopeptidase [Agrobacterium]|uniref:M14 family metallopeptidase n=1 Tax=Agrobacterium TaxID=357 RepID=UPI0022B8F11D|nr:MULTISPECIES: M14 family metallopeptidase [Agrobacterium]MCZ7854013.1 M14 family metallopeptidase [Agrobacterium salinitolerans]MDA5628866.1 M14 family metallopeptidase [Agrobacterium sp. ST15.16.055]MDA6981339.1 M14 family metallopeptidase [Agrobacterium salinitolerans]